MPTRTPSPCPTPGCPHLSPCPDHTPKPWSGGRVDTAGRQARYPKDWARIRARKLATQPWCELCGARAQPVDHIVPKSRGGGDDMGNLQSLCVTCHAKKTAAEGVAARRRPTG